MATGFEEVGVFQINDQWATAIKFEGVAADGVIDKVNLSFMNGRKTIIEVKEVTHEQAVELIGEKNVQNIFSQVDPEKLTAQGELKGKLQSDGLAFKQGFSPDYAVNTIELGGEPDLTIDAEVRAAARKQASRRRQADMQLREVISKSERSEESTVQGDVKETDITKDDSAEKIPASVKNRFVQVDDKFYFPDDTLAFEDKGERLRARAEHKEVVNALIAIADARGWDEITVKGTKVFKQAVWMEAASRGISVSGFKPTEIDLAKLKATIAKREKTDGKDTDVQIDGNEVIKGNVQELTQSENKALDATPHDNASAAEKIAGAPLREHVGELVDHGEDHYEFNKENALNYFVKLKTEKGIKTIWGKDLKRAMAEQSVEPGKEIRLQYMGNQPVTVQGPEYDEHGNTIGTKTISTHRNTWQLEKAETFRTQGRDQVLKKHKDLAPAYGALAAVKKFAEKEYPLDQAKQQRIVNTTKENIAERIEKGEKLPATKVMKKKVVTTKQEKVAENARAKESEEQTR